ncbi:hypothetical protein CVT26_015023 [Gymnopilus dilepis]|uniref:CCHC-type domain-containing protein n=1 Tax=Gymnopilus dilepis TaxID=231916 RepID=A0A409YNM5_9AGAR|nr:hypothetical protein CVT26_015023 [Gymnopilus dilepis]
MSANPTASNPTVFPDSEKFDGTNWFSWKRAILTAAEIKGADGYLLGQIPQPSPAPPPSTNPQTIPLPPDPTPWDSPTPSASEWKMRNAWTKGLIMYNCINPVGLGVDLAGTAADAWAALVSLYDISSDVAAVNAQRDLRNTMFKDGDDLMAHISTLRTKWRKANASGANITDADFRMILLSSLPPSWDMLVATLYDTKTSMDVITRISTHWERIKGQSQPKDVSATALATGSRKPAPCSNLQCSNCGRRGHLKDRCYWPGRGVEGQFPPGFGKRGGETGLAQAAQMPSSKPTANVAVVSEKAFALVTRAAMAASTEARRGTTPTYADSGASDNCFTR